MNRPDGSHTEFRFASEDGLQIACGQWAAAGSVRGIVQIAHGMGEHSGRYSELIGALQEAGYVVYANDHRGHGRTAVSSQQLGDFGEGGFDLLVKDMVELTRIARRENPAEPVVLLGHSMGSFAAQQYILDHSGLIDGLALSGSGILDGLARLAVAAAATQPNFLNARFEPARTPADWLSRETSVVDAFLADPLCFPILQAESAKSFLGASARLADPQALSRIRPDLPLYLFSGSEDPVGQQLEGVRTLIGRYQKAGLRNITHDFYPGGRHEMLNELNRVQVRRNLLAWLSTALRDESHQSEAL